MPYAIKIENLSKQYRLGLVGTGTLSHDLKRQWALIRGKEDPYLKIGEDNDRSLKGDSDYVWALKDINLEVKEGEILGIIGRNGAGKSTLLKVLSRVTGPTTGTIKYKGRIGSLLEVGTGFHSELTGRENIYLNGAILGMRRKEIDLKLDEIIDFSGCSRYIDTPVKRYSSGMMVRLGFAVAAFLEPEILVVDEVLAVGDFEFQRKAIGKMQDVSKGNGRTVLFVSHNMAAIKKLCESTVVLSNGKIIYRGKPEKAVEHYLTSSHTGAVYEGNGSIENWLGNEKIRIKCFRVKSSQGNSISISSGVTFELEFINYLSNINLDVTFELRTFDDIAVFHTGKVITSKNNSRKGIYKISSELPPNFLNAGRYKFKLIFGRNQYYSLYINEDIVNFEVLNETAGSNNSVLPGIIRPVLDYKIDFAKNDNGKKSS